MSSSIPWGPLQRLVMPHAFERVMRMRTSNDQLVHYTTADTAYKIVKNRTMWLRNALVMNDYSELEFGDRHLRAAWKSRQLGDRLIQAVDAAYDNLGTAVWHEYTNRFRSMRESTYMLCVSEHPPDEDTHGRLSMWRAYGGQSGVALVINKEMFDEGAADYPGLYSSPVGYFDAQEFEDKFVEVVTNLEGNIDLLRRYSRQAIWVILLRSLQFATLSTKHPGFHEEREWRVLYLPREIDSSQFIAAEQETIAGVPQTVHKLYIKSVGDVVNKIIVGPCDQPLMIRNAMISALNSHGVADAENRVTISDIPLRHPSYG